MRKAKFSSLNLISAVLLIAITAFVFIGCPTTSNPKPKPSQTLSDAAELTGVTLETDTAGITVPAIVPGTVITEAQLTAGAASLANEQTKQIVITGLTGSPQFYVTLALSKDATAKVVKGAGATLPTVEAFTTAPAYVAEQAIQLGTNNYFYVQVTSQNQETVNYYRFWVLASGANASITSVVINGVEATNGTQGLDDWATVVPGKVELNSTNAANAPIVITAAAGATAEWAVQPKASAATPPATFGNPTSYSFQDGDTLYIKVTASNGTTIFNYKIAARIGWDASLILTGGVKLGADEASAIVASTGTPAEVEKGANGSFPAVDFAAIVAGNYEPGIKQPAGGTSIFITANDVAATVSIAVINGATTTPTDTDFTTLTNANRTKTFVDGDYLWIKVLSQNGNVARYYKIGVIFAQTLNVFYGQPEIKPSSEKYIDPLWTANDFEVFDVSRVNKAEADPAYRFTNTVVTGKNHTAAKVKALWDDEGLYFYADVDFTDYYDSPADKTAGNVTPRTMTAGIGTSGSEHNCDSVEVFTNERYQFYKSGNNGMQYRVSRAADGSAIISGLSNNRPNGVPDPIAFFRDSGMYSTWIKEGAGGKQLGYVVIARVPWALIGDTNTSEVFDENGLVKAEATTGPAIGMELQFNASATTGRDALLTWNGITTAAWNSCTNYGIVNLVLGPGRSRGPLKAATPTISAQPQSRQYGLPDITGANSVPPITVTSPANPGNVKTYQWYIASSATANPATDTAATGETATTAAYVPTITTGGTYYYYVVVTNNRASADEGFKTASVTSNVATITVTNVSIPVIKLQPKSTDYATDSITVLPLKIETSVAPAVGTNLTIQWYSVDRAVGGTGAIVSGATNATFTPPITTEGVTYYYAVVTNSNGTSADDQVVTSNRAKIDVKAAGTPVDFVFMPNPDRTTTAVTADYNSLLEVPLPSDFDITKYDKYTFDYRVFNGTDWETATAAANNAGIQVKWRQNATALCVWVDSAASPPDTGSLGTAWGWDTGFTQANSGQKRDIPAYLLKVGSHTITGGTGGDGINAAGTIAGSYSVAALKHLTFERLAVAGVSNFLIVDKVTFHLKPVPVPPAAPYNVDLSGERRVTADGEILNTYDGLTVALNLPATFNPKAYNKIDFVVKCFDEDGNLLTGTGILAGATLFIPAEGESFGYTADDFPGYGSAERLQAFTITAAAAAEPGSSYNLNISIVPQGFRVEVEPHGGWSLPLPDPDAYGIEIVSIKFWHTEYDVGP